MLSASLASPSPHTRNKSLLTSHEARQSLRGTDSGQQPDVDLGLAKACRLCCEPYVTVERRFEAGAHGYPRDRREQWL